MWARPRSCIEDVHCDGMQRRHADAKRTVNLAITNPTGGVTLGTPNTAVLTISNSTVFGGTTSVGTAEGITSLTNPSGLFDQLKYGSPAIQSNG
jgi:hypothetical protein